MENYKPLYSGRHYYYDKQYNQIVYVNEEDGKIIYPAEHKGEEKNDHDWFSLSMSVAKTKEPTGNYTNEGGKITAKVANTEEYAYVIEQYNNKGGNLDLTITGNVDLMGARCLINKVENGKEVIIKGENSPVTIKNVTSNEELEPSTNSHNNQNVKADYYIGGLIAKVFDGANVTIENVIFENVNTKRLTAGGAGVVIGVVQNANVTFKNVTVKNSSVIGHRDVGALVGAVQNCNGTNNKGLKISGIVNIENVNVKTTGGRSALVVGKLNGESRIEFETGADLTINNSKVSVYENDFCEQKFADGEVIPGEWVDYDSSKVVKIEGQDQFIYSYKGLDATTNAKVYSVYGYKADALVLINGSSATWKAITSLDALKNGVSAA